MTYHHPLKPCPLTRHPKEGAAARCVCCREKGRQAAPFPFIQKNQKQPEIYQAGIR